MPSPLGAVRDICRGQMLLSLATSQPSELQPCSGDSIVSLSPLGCATRRSRPSPPPIRPSRLCVSVLRRQSQESRRRTWRLGCPGTACWWPQRLARSCQRVPSPKHLSGVACLAPRNNIIQLLPVLFAGWELSEPERSLSTLKGRRGCGREGRRSRLHLARGAARRGAGREPGSGRCEQRQGAPQQHAGPPGAPRWSEYPCAALVARCPAPSMLPW